MKISTTENVPLNSIYLGDFLVLHLKKLVNLNSILYNVVVNIVAECRMTDIAMMYICNWSLGLVQRRKSTDQYWLTKFPITQS